MRPFAWILVTLGLLLIPASWVYAHFEHERLVEVWDKRVLESYDSREIERSIIMLQRGLVPGWTVVSPWPGTFTGAGSAAFGIILLAIRRPA